MTEFSEQNLLETLARISKEGIAAFGLLCANRLAVSVAESRRETEQFDILGKSRAAVISFIAGEPDADAQIHLLESPLLDSVPAEDEYPTFEDAVVEDAMSSMVYVIRSITNEGPQNAAWAAARPYETADRFASQLINETTISADAELTILAHPLVQQELSRQRRDMERISDIDSRGARREFLDFIHSCCEESVLKLA